jgi:hypothetical protein
MICPRCGKEIEDSSSPFSDDGDFYSCKCGVEGYGYHEADGGYRVSFTISSSSESDEENEV